MSEHICRIVVRDGEDDGQPMFRIPETGERLRYAQLPAGALYEDTYPDHDKYRPNPAGDGHTWTVKLPCGTRWRIDAPSSDGGYWTRQGVAPAFTVSPSIHITTTRYTFDDPADPDRVTGQGTVTVYHGHLLAGKLVGTQDSPC